MIEPAVEPIDHQVAREAAEGRRGTGTYPDMVLEWWLWARGRTFHRSGRARIAYAVKADTPPQYGPAESRHGAFIACECTPAKDWGSNEPRLPFKTIQGMEPADST